MDEERALSRSLDVEQATLSQRLREAREYLGLSQEAVAEHLSIPRASVSAIESAKRKVSSVELARLARLYRRPLNFFLPNEGEEPQPEDETFKALFRTTRELTDTDRQQVLQFARFLRSAGPAPAIEGTLQSPTASTEPKDVR